MELSKTSKNTKKNSPEVGNTSKIKRFIPLAHGVGRRKSSVARAWLRRGTGRFLINGRDYLEYFTSEVTRLHAYQPISLLQSNAKIYDIDINVVGGGSTGQAGAARVAIARALALHDQSGQMHKLLRSEGLLTVDSRLKERKKYGKKAARRSFQFVKR